MLTEHKISFCISHSLTILQDTSLTDVQHQSPALCKWPHSATYDWMLHIKCWLLSPNISQNTGLDDLAAQGESHSMQAVLNANEQAGACLAFLSRIHKQTNWIYERMRSPPSVRFKWNLWWWSQRGAGWLKKGDRERREEGRRERTCSEYKNPSNSTVSRVKHTGWNYAHIPQLAFPKVPQLSWLVAKVLTCQSNQLLTLNEQNTSVGHLWPMWAE